MSSSERQQQEQRQDLRGRQQQRAQQSEHQKALSTLAKAQRQFFDAPVEAGLTAEPQTVEKSKGEAAEKARQGVGPRQ